MNCFVEGLQGSGKSTLVWKFSRIHPELRTVREGEYSPTELAWCAYMDEEQYGAMLEKYPAMRGQIEEKTHREGDRLIVCYTKIAAEDRKFYSDMEEYEIYNGRVPWGDFRDIVLGRYRRWTGGGMIFECSLFQNIVEDMTLFRNAGDKEIMAFYRDVRDALEGRDYRILYLAGDDIPGNLEAIRRERTDSHGNENWFPLMLRYFDESQYAKARGVKGEEALLEHFAHRQELELAICREIFPDKAVVLESKGYTDAELAGV